MTGVALFAAFRGERYADAATLARRIAPPYDVITPAQRAELASQDPANIVHVDLPVAEGGADPYGAAGRLLEAWRRDGVLTRDPQPRAYVLRTTSRLESGRVRVRTGVFLAVAAEPFATGRILPHEQTQEGPKEDRRRLMEATGYNLSSIFLLAPDATGELETRLCDATTAAPWACAEALGARHEVWAVEGDIARELARVAGLAACYIADGHHRYETAVAFRDQAPSAWRAGASRALAHVVSFHDPGLEILPTHRVVDGQPLAPAAVLAAAAPYFAPAPSAEAATLTAVFGDGSEAHLVLRPGADLTRGVDLTAHPAVRSLPVAVADAVLVRVVLASLLGAGSTVRFTPSAGEARAVVRRGGAAVAVLLPPTRLDEVRRVADARQAMPPKSTFFAPKIPTGVVVRPLDADG